jgi:hypothetical protein
VDGPTFWSGAATDEIILTLNHAGRGEPLEVAYIDRIR